MKKRIISFAIVLCMLVSLLPTAAFASEPRRVKAYYDMNRIGMFITMGGGTPVADAESIMMDNAEYFPGYVGGEANTVKILFDPTKGFDRDNYELYDREPDDDYALFVTAGIATEDGGDIYDTLVADGAAVFDGVTFEDGVLTLPMTNICDVEIQVFLSRAAYDYSHFSGTEDNPIIVDINSWGGPLVNIPGDIAESDTFRAYDRVKVRVSAARESVLITWNEEDVLDRITVDRAGPDGEQLVIDNPEGSSYALLLNQTFEGRPEDYYSIDFYFEEQRDDDYTMCLHYDMNGGIAYVKTGAYDGVQYDNRESEFDLSPITVKLDNTKRIDWDTWDWDDPGCVPELVDNEPWDDLSVSVIAHFDTPDGSFHDPVVVDGAAVADGFTYENGVLTFTPAGRRRIDLDIVWTRNEYDYFMFGGTEEKPVLVEAYYQDGVEVILPDDVNEEDIYRESSRFKARVAQDRESFEIRWDGSAAVRGVRVNYGSDWQDAELPDGNSFTVTLDAKDDHGNPNYHYQVEFDFDTPREDDYTMCLHYDMNGGIAYVKTGAYDGVQYDSRESEFDLSPITVKLDNTKRIDWDTWNWDDPGCVPELVDNEPWDDLSVSVIAHFDLPNGERFDGPVVEHGAAVAEGFSFSDGTLQFDPPAKHRIDLDVFWTDADYSFACFAPTEEKPVLVELRAWGNGSFDLPAFIADEDKMTVGERTIFRISAQEHPSIELTWTGSKVERFRAELENGWYEEQDPEFDVYELKFDQKWDNGAPKDRYQVEINFRGEAVRPGARIENRGIDFDVAGLVSTGGNEYEFEDGTRNATVTIDTSNERFHAVQIRTLRFGAEPEVTLFAPEGGVVTLPNDGSFYDIEFVDWDVPLGGEFRVDSYGMEVRIAGKAVDTDEKQKFTAGTPITFTVEQTPYRVIVFPEYNGEDPVELDPGSKTFSYTPATDTGFTIYIFANESQYHFHAFNMYNDFSRNKIVPIEFEYQDGDREDGWFEPVGEVIDSVEGFDVFMIKVDRNERYVPVRVCPTFGYKFRLFIGEREVTDEVENDIYTIDTEGEDILRAVLVKDDTVPEFYAQVYGSDTKYREGDTIYVTEGEDAYIGFFIEGNNNGIIVTWDGSGLASSEITAAEDPVFIDGYPYLKITGTGAVGTSEPVESYWVRWKDIFGENPVGIENAEKLLRHTVNIEIAEKPVVAKPEVYYVTRDAAGMHYLHESGDVLKMEKDSEILVAFCLKEAMSNVIVGWRNDILKGQGFAIQDDPEFIDGTAYAKIKATVPVGTKATMPYSWYNYDDIFGEGAVGWQDAVPLFTYTLNIEVVEHSWGAPTYEWSDDLGEVTATRICEDDGTHFEQEKVKTVYTVTKEPTETEEGVGTYTATFKNAAFTAQTKTVTIDKLAPTTPKVEFTDVVKGSYYEDAVSWAVANNVTAGTSATTFSPNNKCTRGQVVTFLWRAQGSPEPKTTVNPFTDVKATGFYYKAVLWAVENNVTAGLSATTFGPNKECTRGQVVTFLWRAMGEPAPKSTAHPFTDVKADGFYFKAMLWAVENNVTNGTSATTFGPNKTCTRGQVVTFLYRAVNVK